MAALLLRSSQPKPDVRQVDEKTEIVRQVASQLEPEEIQSTTFDNNWIWCIMTPKRTPGKMAGVCACESQAKEASCDLDVHMKQRWKLTLLALLPSLCGVVLVGILIKWSWRSKAPVVSFSQWVAVKPIEAENEAFRFAVANMVSAEETWAKYKELVDYIAARIGDKASIVLRPSYFDVRMLLEQRRVEVAFVCTGTYIVCSQAGSVELLAVPEFKDNAKYRCLFIVRDDSTVNEVADLRGKTFAFTDPESNTGCVVPSWLVSRQGISPEAFFGKIVYAGSHDRSLHAVIKGVVEGASVDSLVFYSFARTHPEFKERLRVIWQSEAFGAPPIVVPSNLPTTTKEKLRTVFLSMSQETQGRAILDGLGIERFRMPEEGEYDSANEIWKATHSLK